ncbi:MAG: VTT domain-containing protein [Firmicutes bacterium]|nr:VTT domain-containing protein [Bacillota bacterium]
MHPADVFPSWLQSLVGSMGGVGLFVVAFLDSSVLSFPVLNDVLVIHLSMQAPARMPYYALMATLGSLAGSLCLYEMARRGSRWFVRTQSASARATRIRHWLERNGFLSIAIPSVLPPPMPFKAFVLAAGGFGLPLRTFVLALLVGRGLRYFGEGVLAVRYGEHAVRYLVAHKLEFAVGVIALFALGHLLTRRLLRPRSNGPAPG